MKTWLYMKDEIKSKYIDQINNLIKMQFRYYDCVKNGMSIEEMEASGVKFSHSKTFDTLKIGDKLCIDTWTDGEWDDFESKVVTITDIGYYYNEDLESFNLSLVVVNDWDIKLDYYIMDLKKGQSTTRPFADNIIQSRKIRISIIN